MVIVTPWLSIALFLNCLPSTHKRKACVLKFLWFEQGRIGFHSRLGKSQGGLYQASEFLSQWKVREFYLKVAAANYFIRCFSLHKAILL